MPSLFILFGLGLTPGTPPASRSPLSSVATSPRYLEAAAANLPEGLRESALELAARRRAEEGSGKIYAREGQLYRSIQKQALAGDEADNETFAVEEQAEVEPADVAEEVTGFVAPTRGPVAALGRTLIDIDEDAVLLTEMTMSKLSSLLSRRKRK